MNCTKLIVIRNLVMKIIVVLFHYLFSVIAFDDFFLATLYVPQLYDLDEHIWNYFLYSR